MSEMTSEQIVEAQRIAAELRERIEAAKSKQVPFHFR